MSKNLWLGTSEQHLHVRGDGHRLLPEVSDAFDRMQADAAKAGIDMQIASSFRSFDQQLNIWQQKWNGQRTLYSLQGTPLEFESLSDEHKLHAILTWSALPGGSRHHWGTDLDVYDKTAVEACGQPLELVPEEYSEGGPCYRLSNWLEQHAESYGFYRPYAAYSGGVAPEAWHMSYRPIATDIINTLDLDVLRRTLDASALGGKALVLSQLPSLFKRYTLNGDTI